MNTQPNTPGRPLAFWGYLLCVAAVLAAGAAWTTVDSDDWVFSADYAASIGGPILLAGVLLIVGGHIIDAVRNR